MSANGSESISSRPCSTPLIGSMLSSGPKISSRSAAESGAKSLTTAGAEYQPPPGTSRAVVAMRRAARDGVVIRSLPGKATSLHPPP